MDMEEFKTKAHNEYLREDLGKASYEAYCEAVGGKSIRGEDLPTWEEQVAKNPKIAFAWCSAGAAARNLAI